MFTGIIIDDMPRARQLLKADLASHCPEIQVIGEADGVVSGAKLLKTQQPDVVFLDIQLKDGTGFDLLEIIPNIKFQIIFTTASDEFAIQAFRMSALDYLLKPIGPEELKSAVNKLSANTKKDPQQFDLLLDQIRQHENKRIALHTSEKIHVTRIESILRCESFDNYTSFYFKDGKKLLVTRTLKEFEKLLEPYRFFRTHQSHLVNMECIQEFVKVDGGYLVMQDGTKVPVSVRKKPGLIKLLSSI